MINALRGIPISAAEHAIAMLTSLGRNIPANAALKGGRWERASFMGVELITRSWVSLAWAGSAVKAKRASSMGMTIIAYDPHISTEHAEKLGVTLVPLEEIYKIDFITLHIPKTKDTYHLIGCPGIRADEAGGAHCQLRPRGLIDEAALNDAINDGKVVVPRWMFLKRASWTTPFYNSLQWW